MKRKLGLVLAAVMVMSTLTARGKEADATAMVYAVEARLCR